MGVTPICKKWGSFEKNGGHVLTYNFWKPLVSLGKRVCCSIDHFEAKCMASALDTASEWYHTNVRDWAHDNTIDRPRTRTPTPNTNPEHEYSTTFSAKPSSS